MTASTAPFIARAADEGPSLSVGENHIIFKVVSEDSQGDLIIVQCIENAGCAKYHEAQPIPNGQASYRFQQG